jgi:hypothetical protein
MTVLLQISDRTLAPSRATGRRSSDHAGHASSGLMWSCCRATSRSAPVRRSSARHVRLDRLGAPVLAVPGNHDIPLFDLWARLRSPYGRYSAAFGTETSSRCTALPELLVVCVNTTRPWRHKDGEVSALQIDRVARLAGACRPCAAARGRGAPAHSRHACEDEPNRLRGHAAALQRWAEAGADLVMGGHIHLPYVMPLQGLARPLWVVQAGTAVSSRVRDRACPIR